MQKLLATFGSLAVGLMTVSAQTYYFTNIAGSSPAGYADGVGRAALFNTPADIAVDSSGNLFVADSANHVIRRVTPAGVVTTVAGAAGQQGNTDGPASHARFAFPRGITIDHANNVYVVGYSTIRKITPDGMVTTVAGRAGQPGSADGRAETARFDLRADGGIAADREGNLYVADFENHTIRKVSVDGMVTTLAGKAGISGNADGNGSAARFNWPVRLTVDAQGNLIVSDWYNGALRKVTPGGEVTTIHRQKDYEPFYHGVATDGSGNIYALSSDDGIGDNQGGEVIRLSPAGLMTKVAGSFLEALSTDGTGDAARFFNPRGLARDASGTLYITDTMNHGIRRITPEGVVTTLAGNTPAHADGVGPDARFIKPRAVAIDKSGNVVICDDGSIRKVAPSGVVTTVTSSTVGPAYWPCVVVDGLDNIYFTEGYSTQYVRKINPAGEKSTVIELPNRSAVRTLAVDRANTLFFLGVDNTVGKITPDGRVITIAGTARRYPNRSVDGVGADAEFFWLRGIVANSQGDLIAADSNNTIRKISADGRVTTLAGANEIAGSADGPGPAARFFSAEVIGVDGNDAIYVSDMSGFRRLSNGVVTTLAATPTTAESPSGWPYVSFCAVDTAGAIFAIDPQSLTLRKGIPLSSSVESRLVNVSALARLSAGSMSVGFSLRGGARPVLIRAAGPALRPFLPGVTVAGDPRLEIFNRQGQLAASNENWGGGAALTAAFAFAGAFPFESASADAASVFVAAGSYNASVTSTTSGAGLFELYDLGSEPGSGIANLTIRHRIENTLDPTFTLGFTIEGSMKTVLIRGIDTAPASFGGILLDPKIAVINGRGETIAANDNWNKTLSLIFDRVGASGLSGARFDTPGSADAALLLTLPPGAYSVILSGAPGATGEAMIEIFEVP